MTSSDGQHASGEEAPSDEDEEHRDEHVSRVLIAQKRSREAKAPSQRFRDVDEQRLLNLSQMPTKHHLLFRLLARWAFRKVTFDERHVRTIREAAEGADTVFTHTQVAALAA